jgi:beta-lactamase class C
VTLAARAKVVLEPQPDDRIDYRALDDRLQRLIARPGMVGMAVGVIEDGRIRFLKGYGETAAGSGQPVTPDTVFRWASVSKGVAGTLVAKMEEEGRLRFDQKLATLVPSLRLPNGYEQSATVSDLLSHRLGLYRNAYDNKLEEGGDAAVLRQTLVMTNAVCPPGTCSNYQNVAYDGASEMVTKVTGQNYADVARSRLFGPLGMTSASMSLEALEANANWARPHDRARRVLPSSQTYYKVPAAAGVNSNIKDMALWMLAQAGAAPDVLSPRLLATIHADRVATPAEARRMARFRERLTRPHYGYGWRSYDYAGHRLIGHRGGIRGYRSALLFDPATKTGIAMLWNSEASQPAALEFELFDMAYGLPFRDWTMLDRAAAPRGSAPAAVEADTDTAASAGDGNGRDR